MSEYLPEGKLIDTRENQAILHSERLLREAMEKRTILEARAKLCDSSHNLCVELGSVRGVIPREEGALGIKDGSVRDIAVISRVNRPVCFTVSRLEYDSDGTPLALLSRADAVTVFRKSCQIRSELHKSAVIFNAAHNSRNRFSRGKSFGIFLPGTQKLFVA